MIEDEQMVVGPQSEPGIWRLKQAKQNPLPDLSGPTQSPKCLPSQKSPRCPVAFGRNTAKFRAGADLWIL
jgi:hypothetical protein